MKWVLFFICAGLASLGSARGEDPADAAPLSLAVYSNNFDRAAGPEWSNPSLAKTPKEGRGFLGQFGAGTVSLKLERLLPHRFVRLRFDLFLMGTWDGNSQWGPDIWELSVQDGPRLVHTTFTTCGFFSDNNAQTFPHDHPHQPWHKAWTGALEKQSLGYKRFNKRNNGKGYITDGVYRMELIFPHQGEQLGINFRSLCDDPKKDQSWGLDNVQVETVATATRLSPKQLQAAWSALGGKDPMAAFKAQWSLVSAGEQAVSFMSGAPQTKAQIQASDLVKSLLKDLDDQDFQTRELATRRLAALGDKIKPALRQALDHTESEEAGMRIKALLTLLPGKVGEVVEESDTRRPWVERILQVIDTPSAKKLLEQMRSGN